MSECNDYTSGLTNTYMGRMILCRLLLTGDEPSTNLCLSDNVIGEHTMTYDRLNLESIAHECMRVYTACTAENADLFGGSLLDLLADNLPDVPLRTLVDAIVVAGIYASANDRIRKAIAGYEQRYR